MRDKLSSLNYSHKGVWLGKWLFAFALVLCSHCIENVSAAGFGALDPSFNPRIDPIPGYASTCIRTADQKLLVGGGFSLLNGVRRNGLALLNDDGSLDESFDPPLGAEAVVNGAALLTDGSIIVTVFGVTNNLIRGALVKLTPSGQIDSDFGAEIESVGYSSLILSNCMGGLYVCGGLTRKNDTNIFPVARLDASGSVDTGFSPQFGPGTSFSSIHLQSDGKLLLAGDLVSTNKVPRFDRSSGSETYFYEPFPSVVRLNEDGSFDNTFSAANAGLDQVNSVLSRDGLIYLSIVKWELDVSHPAIVRLFGNGQLDSDFSVDFGSESYIGSLAFDTRGRLLVGGNLSTAEGSPLPPLVRILSYGDIDSHFHPDIATNASPLVILPRNDGGMDLAGSLLLLGHPETNSLVRLNQDGSVVNNNFPWLEDNAVVQYHSTLPDGRICIAGRFNFIEGKRHVGVAILNPDGSVDGGFNSPFDYGSYISQAALEFDGGILVNGDFVSIDGVDQSSRLIRLNPSGCLDHEFDPGFSIFASEGSIVPQKNGKIWVGGSLFSIHDPQFSFSSFILASFFELNHDGSVSRVIDHSAGVTSYAIYSVHVQTDGKPIVRGSFQDSDGNDLPSILRFTEDGQNDSSFQSGVNGMILAVQSDGKLLVNRATSGSPAGRQLNTISAPIVPLFRVNADGSVDSGFNAALATNSFVASVAVQRDGKLLLAGSLYGLDGQLFGGIVRLNGDGSFDSSFQADNRLNSAFSRLAIQSDGNILALRAVSPFGRGATNSIVRILSLEQPLLSGPSRDSDGNVHFSLNGDANRTYQIQTSTDLIHWCDLDTVFSASGSIQFVEQASGCVQQYYRAVAIASPPGA